MASNLIAVTTPAGTTQLTDVAFAFLEYLLDYQWKHKHHRQSYDPSIVKTQALTYLQLTTAVGKGNHRKCGSNLIEIHRICEANGWPPLNALVIRQAARKTKSAQGPGARYPSYKGFPTNAALDAYACLTFDYPPNAVKQV